MGQADLSLGDGAFTPYPGLAATLAHGMDFFDRPSGVVIPQFASSLSASLDPQSAGNALQASNADQDDASTSSTITSSRDYDRFSDPVASSSPAAGAYDQFSDAVTSAPRSVGGFFSDAVASSQVTPAASSNSSQTVASESAARNAGGSSSYAVANSPPAASPYDQFSDVVGSAPRSVGGFFSDAVASSQVGPGTSGNFSGAAASDGAPRSVGGLFSDAVASSQVGAGAQSDPVWDPFGEVAASAPVGRAIGPFVDQAKVALRPSFKGFGDYLSESAESLAQAPRDIAGYASDLADNPIEFLRRTGPTFTGLGFSIPTIGVGASAGAVALRGGPAAAEEISALAAPSEALLSRGTIAGVDAEAAASEAGLVAPATEGTSAAGETVAPVIEGAPATGEPVASETAVPTTSNSVTRATPNAAPTSPGGVNNATATGQRIYSNGLTPGQQAAANWAKGKAFEQLKLDEYENGGLYSCPQLMIETQSGSRAVPDALVVNPETGEMFGAEFKASRAARLSKPQMRTYDEAEKTGFTVRGSGGRRYVKGQWYPPMKFIIERPE